PPHGPICAASLFGLRAGTGEKRRNHKAQKSCLIYAVLLLQNMSYCGIIIVSDKGAIFLENSCGKNTKSAGEREAVTSKDG
ncbi:hypothetical protein, partial [Lawsonibacter hominis]|uniref:hypothetical protein n=1 Tax=Lawsonibacter hominis TaxID=2763053 RepID=UPI0033244562